MIVASVSRSQYDKRPSVAISENEKDCSLGWSEILEKLPAHARRIAIECYPGVLLEPLRTGLISGLAPELILESSEAMLPAAEVEARFAETLSTDPVFGFISRIRSMNSLPKTELKIVASGPGQRKVESS